MGVMRCGNAVGNKVADIIVDTLQKAGVKHCYGVAGDTLNLIARSLEQSKIEWAYSNRNYEFGIGGGDQPTADLSVDGRL